jgi:hypothetical protein
MATELCTCTQEESTIEGRSFAPRPDSSISAFCVLSVVLWCPDQVDDQRPVTIASQAALAKVLGMERDAVYAAHVVGNLEPVPVQARLKVLLCDDPLPVEEKPKAGISGSIPLRLDAHLQIITAGDE